MFDTSVYGRFADDLSLTEKLGRFVPTEYVVYGTKIIRDELRETPRKIKVNDASKRILLLKIYDSFVRKDHHDLKENKLVHVLSQDYFKEYKRQKGHLSEDSMRNDLIIIATATIYQLDIVVSDDERSMLSDAAIKAYDSVNKKYGLKNPTFKKYSDFKKEVIRRFSRYGTQ